jgi:hypothetical protein
MGTIPSCTLSRTIKAALVLFAVYFPIALYLTYSYVPKPDLKVEYLSGPFRKLDATAYLAKVPKLEGIGDSSADPFRSTVVLLENGQPIGPPHSRSEIANGRYQHWRAVGIIFSASDNSDPNSNGRTYSITWQ